MPAKVLTARAVEAARPKRNAKGELVRNEIPDAGCLGLYLVVGAHRHEIVGASLPR